MNQDDFLERAIDQVARELTDGSPRHGFAGRVRQRLEAPRAVVGWRWQMSAAAIAALLLIVWFALPGPTGGPARPPRIEAMDRVLPPPPLAARGEARPVPIAREPRTMRHRVPQKPPLDNRIPVDIEGAPQLAAIGAPVDLALPPIEIPELTIAPLEPEKESR